MVHIFTGRKKLVHVRNFLLTQKEKNKILIIGGTKEDEKFISFLGFTNITSSNIVKQELLGCKKKKKVLDISKPLKSKGEYDIIIAMDVIEHLIEPDIAISNMNSLLKKKGILVITTPNLASIFNRIFLLLGWSLPNYSTSNIKTGNPLMRARIGAPVRDSMPHKSVFTFRQLKELFEVYGFEVISSKGYDYGSQNAGVGGGNFASIRGVINVIIPNSMKEGMFFVCRKKKDVDYSKIFQKYSN